MNTFYEDNDVYLQHTQYINDISEDIYILAMTIIEDKPVEGISNIIIQEEEMTENNINDEYDDEDRNEYEVEDKENEITKGSHYLIDQLSKIIKNNCDSIKNDFTKQISELKQKEIENEKKICNMDKRINE